jgi:hypothetical protein
MIGDELKPLFVTSSNRTRRPDPPTKSRLARERALASRAPAKELIIAKLDQMAERMRELESMVAEPMVPPALPSEPVVPVDAPPPPQLKYDKKLGWHIPCTLTPEELRNTQPSAETVRRLRLAAEQREEAERAALEEEYLRLRGGTLGIKQRYDPQSGRMTWIPEVWDRAKKTKRPMTRDEWRRRLGVKS